MVLTPPASTLSGLLRIALADLRKVEALPLVYTVEMGEWHVTDSYTQMCSVCLAGAVLAQTCNQGPAEFTGDIPAWMGALNELRMGDVWFAGEELGINTKDFPDRPMPLYGFDIEAFHTAAGALADDLEAAGL